ncbi:uncharacterized protein LOC105686145 [Athalia rosae]|uniref:uncharacterized protein LOC105686145 n=1 Tax=Athalia rosae TaxID=37344 RepID=UPI0020334302|nr:uncharacterized protein LOC105686145 [Athalia rosae]
MAEEDSRASATELSIAQSSSSLAPRSLRAASSFLKSLSTLTPGKSRSTHLTSNLGSLKSPEKSDVSVSAVEFGSNLPPENKTIDQNADLKTSSLKGLPEEKSNSLEIYKPENPSWAKMRPTKFMRQYPELFRRDVSINPSYTGLKNFPYHVICRQRCHKNKVKMTRQLNREIHEITMMQSLALDGVRVERIFTVGFPASAAIIPDPLTPQERLRLNRLFSER